MKNNLVKFFLIIGLIGVLTSACHTGSPSRNKHQTAKKAEDKDEVEVANREQVRPVLIIGTASILYKFWFNKASEE